MEVLLFKITSELIDRALSSKLEQGKEPPNAHKGPRMSWPLIQEVNLPSPISNWDRHQHLLGSKAPVESLNLGEVSNPRLFQVNLNDVQTPFTLVRKTVQTASEDNVNIKESVIG